MELYRILGILFVVMVLQAILSWLQIRQICHVIQNQKQRYQNQNYFLAVGSSKSKLLSFSKGVILVLVIDSNNIIMDYHQLEGFSVFSKMKRIPAYIGQTTQEVSETLKKKHQKNAFSSALEQIEEKQYQVSYS